MNIFLSENIFVKPLVQNELNLFDTYDDYCRSDQSRDASQRGQMTTEEVYRLILCAILTLMAQKTYEDDTFCRALQSLSTASNDAFVHCSIFIYFMCINQILKHHAESRMMVKRLDSMHVLPQ